MIKDKIIKRISELVEVEEQLSNDDLIQIIECCGSYLNLQTRAEFAKSNGISYNGAKHFRKNIKLFNVNFIIYNK